MDQIVEVYSKPAYIHVRDGRVFGKRFAVVYFHRKDEADAVLACRRGLTWSNGLFAMIR